MILSIRLIILLSLYSWAWSVSSLSTSPSAALSSLSSLSSFSSADTNSSTVGKAQYINRAMMNCTTKSGICDESKSRAVCGTDNQTYPTRCHLIRAQCTGRKVSLKHRGPCKECLESRTYAIAHRSSSPKKFVPRCRSDGSYAAVQCMGGAGCWCSDGQGKPIPNTTTTQGRPICPKISKVNIRRSPPSRRSRVRNRNCRQSDQRTFNSNLLGVFHNEYKRAHPNEKTIADRTVLDWKFNQLDANKDEKIHKIELKEMRRIIRQAVKPKRCARLFGKLPYCDIDTYGKLSRQEWLNCMNKDRIIPINMPSLQEDDDDDTPSEDEYENEDDDQRSDDKRSFPFFTPVTPYLKTIVETDSMLRETDTEWDCLADRTAALEEQKQNGAVYVPECTPDGRYERTQCYRSVGYCWCVNEDTGKNIPGTSVKDGRPDCVTNSTRPMKGCPEPRKLEFLKELKDFLRTRIVVDTRSSVNVTNWSSEEEKIATLSFILIDKNKNGYWERKEWKKFRELVTVASVLRNCGKKMPRYCDVNSDKKITLSEWLGCLQVRASPYKPKPVETPPERPTQSALKLKGPNPLESYLKSD